MCSPFDTDQANPLPNSVEELQALVQELVSLLIKPQRRIDQLEEQVKLHSGNSSKPLSSDGAPRPDPSC